jgi:fucose 4-O-acetylase-like acetyltransferase
MTRTETPPAAASGTRAPRDPFFDNAKLVLIVLVVLGHNWFPLTDRSPVIKAAYEVVYTFHMPAFVLVSGYLSKRYDGGPNHLRKLVLTVLVPYLIFETAYAWQAALLSHQPFNLHFSSPIYVTWFLLSLFVWRLSAPLWRAVPQPVVIAFAVSFVAAITVPSNTFSLARTLQMVPWFVIGMQLRPEHFERLRTLPVRLGAGLAFVAAAVVAAFAGRSIDLRWFDREYTNDDLHVTMLQFVAQSALLDLATVVLIAAALALVPARGSWMTALGAATMYPFLLHGLVVRFAQHYGVHDTLVSWGLPGLALLTLGAICLALVLGLKPVRVLTAWAVQPGDTWLRRPRLSPS